jgi:hypothetical protein
MKNKHTHSELGEEDSSGIASNPIWLFFLLSLFVLQVMAFLGIWNFAELADKSMENPGLAGTMLIVLATPAVGIIALASGIFLFVQTIIYGEHWQIFYILYSAIIYLVAFALCSFLGFSMLGSL